MVLLTILPVIHHFWGLNHYSSFVFCLMPCGPHVEDGIREIIVCAVSAVA
jgi:hypothetical protein